MKQTFTALFLFVTVFGYTQVTFQKTYGGLSTDYAKSVRQTSDGGYIITGFTSSFGSGQSDIFLMKTDLNGDTLWTKEFGGTNVDEGYSVQPTADGGYIIAGITRSFGAGELDAYLIKTDANGDTLWTKTYGGTEDDWGGSSVRQTTDGGYIMTGSTRSFGFGLNDVYLIKTDSSGDTLWTKTFGGTDNDYGNSVRQTTDGGYIITGSTQSFGFGINDVYLIKTDSSGDTLWTKTFGGTDNDIGNSVRQTTDGGYIITGTAFSNLFYSFDLCLIKTDASGNLSWSKTFGYDKYEVGHSIQQTSDGGYIIAGEAESFGSIRYVYLIKTNEVGDTLWTKVYGGTDLDYGHCVHQTNDGGYIIAGSTYSFGTGNCDVFLIKTDSLGYSGGCNEYNAATFVGDSTPGVGSGGIIGSGGIVSNTSTIVNDISMLDSTLCFEVIGINRSSITSNQFTIFPNPTSSTFTIRGNHKIPSVVKLYDITGKNVKQLTINREQSSIDVSGLAGGLYMWELGATRGKLVIK